MAEAAESFRPPLRFPPWAWLLVLPGVAIGLNELRKGGRERVEVVGAGVVAEVVPDDAPESLRYATRTRPAEPIEATVARIDAELRLHPGLLLFGLDYTTTASVGRVTATEILTALHRRAEVAAVVPVSIGPWLPADAAPGRRAAVAAVRDAWRAGPCQGGGQLLCIDVWDLDDPADRRARIRAGMETASRRLARRRASTQTGR